jgi:hypothetical protein
VTIICSCDTDDLRLKIINNYKNNILISVDYSKDLYFLDLNSRKTYFFETNNEILGLQKIGDTLVVPTKGNWNSHFNNYDDSLLIFTSDKQKLIDYFEGKIVKDSVYELFVISYKELLDKNWLITLNPEQI